ncbi:MAG: hypothetical protein FWD78_17815 [Treponema sp.]|nr:hypothetical protein [Treponema sp.]
MDPRIVRNGEFRWLWYKLIPSNVEITVFTINPVTRSIKSSGRLPSGQVYADFAGLQADFSWEISGDLSFKLKPDDLPELVARENINNDSDLVKIEENYGEKIENFVLQRLKSYADGENEKKMESINLSGSIPELNSEIEAAFPGIEDVSCTIKVVNYPDYTLYQSIKSLYREYIGTQSSALKPDINKEAEKRVNMNLRLDELAKYGELLTQYPILLKYLALEKGMLPEADVQPEK